MAPLHDKNQCPSVEGVSLVRAPSAQEPACLPGEIVDRKLPPGRAESHIHFIDARHPSPASISRSIDFIFADRDRSRRRDHNDILYRSDVWVFGKPMLLTALLGSFSILLRNGACAVQGVPGPPCRYPRFVEDDRSRARLQRALSA